MIIGQASQRQAHTETQKGRPCTNYTPCDDGLQLDLPRVSDSMLVSQTELVDGETTCLQVPHGQTGRLNEVKRPGVLVTEEDSSFEETSGGEKGGGEATELGVEEDGLGEIVGHVSGD